MQLSIVLILLSSSVSISYGNTITTDQSLTEIKNSPHHYSQNHRYQHRHNRHHYHRTLDNLIFEGGGGTKSISFIGALKALKSTQYYENGRFTFEHLYGTSTGCLFAFMTAMGIDPDDMERLAYGHKLIDDLLPINSETFNDGTSTMNNIADNSSWYTNIIDVYRLVHRILSLLEIWSKNQSPGLVGNEKLLSFVNTTLLPLSPYKKQLSLTVTFEQFYEITNYNVACASTQMYTGESIVFNHETHPKMQIIDAVYMSMTVPGLFKPMRYSNENYPMIDGGFTNDFPIEKSMSLSLNQEPNEHAKLNHHGNTNDDSTSIDEFVYAKIDSIQYFTNIYELLVIKRNNFNIIDHNIIWLDSPLKLFDTNLDANIIGLTINRAYLNTISSAILKEQILIDNINDTTDDNTNDDDDDDDDPSKIEYTENNFNYDDYERYKEINTIEF